MHFSLKKYIQLLCTLFTFKFKLSDVRSRRRGGGCWYCEFFQLPLAFSADPSPELSPEASLMPSKPSRLTAALLFHFQLLEVYC